MVGFRKPVEEKVLGSYLVSRVVGRGKQGNEDTTVAVGLHSDKNIELFLGRRD